MLTLRKIRLVITSIVVISISVLTLHAQSNGGEMSKSEMRKQKKAIEKANREKEVNDLLNSYEFTFVAESTNAPLPVGNITLSDQYTVRVTKDKIDCYLPYYGKNDLPNMSASNPFDFSTGQYTLRVQSNDEDPKLIEIKAESQENNNRYTMTFEVFSNGSTSLTMEYNRGSTLIYRGYITKNE